MTWTQGNMVYDYSRNVEIRDVTLGLDEVDGSFSFDVFPNPSKGIVTVSLPENEGEIIVTDLYGKEILRARVENKSLRLQLYESGAYFVAFRSKERTASRKLIVTQ